MVSCPICGPKLSAYCMVLSIWAAIMLSLLGVFFYVRSPALFVDLPLAKGEWEKHNFTYSYVKDKYEKTAINCWIAAGLYVALLIFTFTQQRMNSQANYDMS